VFPKVFPIAAHFYPRWFAQSSPVLSYIHVLKGRPYIFRQKTSIFRSFQWADQNGSLQKKIKIERELPSK
jgi:hypothetical protein